MKFVQPMRATKRALAVPNLRESLKEPIVRSDLHFSDNQGGFGCICPKHSVSFGQMATPTRGRTLDLKRRILERVDACGAGPVWTPVDFLDLGPRAAVDKALQRLVAQGHLRRVDRGLYDKPRVNGLTGKPNAPDSRAVVDAIGRRDQIRFVVDGMTAANDLGLTTAVPARVTVLADARLRPVHLGKQKITFKQAAASRLYWAQRPAMRVVQALHWLHDVVPMEGPRILRRLRAVLADPVHGPTIRQDLKAGLHTLPTWMQSFVRELLDEDGRSGRREPKQEPHASPPKSVETHGGTKAP